MSVQLDATQKNAERAFQMISQRLSSLFVFFETEGVTEVNLNGPNDAWITKYGRREQVFVTDIDEVTASSAVRELASSMGQEAVASTPAGNIDAKMPGYRFSAVLYPVAAFGTMLSIRKHNPVVLSLSDYVNDRQFPQAMADKLAYYMRAGKHMLIGGSTDSGKTTFLNALCREIPQGLRIGSIEDTREIKLLDRQWFAFETNAQRGVTAMEMLRVCMRHSPDRLILGELRGREADDFLAATNAVPGGCIATLHCKSAAMGLRRMEDLCLEGDRKRPLLAIQRGLGEAIDVVVHFEKVDGKRRLSEIVEVEDFDVTTATYRTKSIFNYQEYQ